MGSDETAQIVHGTAVSVNHRAVLIQGPSGSGKSSLALQLICFGAALVADDRTKVWSHASHLWVDAPPTLPAAIEARGVGLIPMALAGPCPLRLVVDMGSIETNRLPPRRARRFFDRDVPLLHKVDGPHFPAAVMQYLLSQSEAAL